MIDTIDHNTVREVSDRVNANAQLANASDEKLDEILADIQEWDEKNVGDRFE